MTLPAFLPANDEPPPIPHNLEAEQAILGALLFDAEALSACAGLQPDHFYEPFHGRLFAEIARLSAMGRRPDPVLVADAFVVDPAFKELGAISYLANLVDRAPPVATAGDYTARLKALSASRNLIALTAEVAARARAGEESGPLLAETERRLVEIVRDCSDNSGTWQSAGQVVGFALDHAKANVGVTRYTTGIADLDVHTGGFMEGGFSVIAGRPGMAKTVMATTVARATAERGMAAAIYSMEMSRQALGLRLACDLAYDRMAPEFCGETSNPTMEGARRGTLNPDQWAKLEAQRARAAALPVFFDFRSGLTVSNMETAAHRFLRWCEQKRIEPGPFMVDHLGLTRPDQDRRGSKVAEISDISGGLREMAKRLGLPVVALCQLSRGVEGRDDKRPTLSDLRWSGEIEQDARQVMFLYRPAYYLRAPDDGDPAKEAEYDRKQREFRNKLFVIVAKNSEGVGTGEVEAHVNVSCSAIRGLPHG